MAMTVRLPAELDARLEELARRRHVSKHALIVEGAELMVDLDAKTARVSETAAGVRARYTELLHRLESA